MPPSPPALGADGFDQPPGPGIDAGLGVLAARGIAASSRPASCSSGGA